MSGRFVVSGLRDARFNNHQHQHLAASAASRKIFSGFKAADDQCYDNLTVPPPSLLPFFPPSLLPSSSCGVIWLSADCREMDFLCRQITCLWVPYVLISDKREVFVCACGCVCGSVATQKKWKILDGPVIKTQITQGQISLQLSVIYNVFREKKISVSRKIPTFSQKISDHLF